MNGSRGDTNEMMIDRISTVVPEGGSSGSGTTSIAIQPGNCRWQRQVAAESNPRRWQTNGIVTFSSGTPVNVTTSNNYMTTRINHNLAKRPSYRFSHTMIRV